MEHKRHRVILLCNPNPHTENTALVLMRAGINLVGIVAARELVGIRRVRSSIKRNGFRAFVSRGLSRLLCRVLNGAQDKRMYEALFDRREIEESIRSAQIPVKLCDRYGEQEVLSWIQERKPDIIVVHSGTFVPRSVRELARTGLVIGGHPGLTQSFRGGSSSFHAIFQNRPEDVGWTVFHIDKGVDTGDLITQGRLQLAPTDSFTTLDWRGMVSIAEEQARLINQFDDGQAIPRHPYRQIEVNTLYWYPRLEEFISYRLRQRRVR